MRYLKLVVVAAFCAVFARPADERAGGKTLTLCELAKHWSDHSGRRVRIRAIYTEAVVQERLYDPACPEAGELAVQWPAQSKVRIGKTVGRLNAVVARDARKRAWVVLDGLYRGPEPYKESEIASNLPPAMREQMRKDHRRYGYMNCCEGIIEVTGVAKIDRVLPETPGRAAP
jgi:hypothetical protein